MSTWENFPKVLNEYHELNEYGTQRAGVRNYYGYKGAFKNIREWLIDTGAAEDMISRRDVRHASKCFKKVPPRTFVTANGHVTHDTVCMALLPSLGETIMHI